MEAYTLLIFAQVQKKLQLDYKTNIMRNHQKIKLYGSPKRKDLKKPHSSTQGEGAEMQRYTQTFREVETHREAWGHGVVWRDMNGQSHTHVWQIKIRSDTSGVRDPSPTPDHTAQSSSTRKISPHIASGCKHQWRLGQQKTL